MNLDCMRIEMFSLRMAFALDGFGMIVMLHSIKTINYIRFADRTSSSRFCESLSFSCGA
jgi:hypothetical protein